MQHAIDYLLEEANSLKVRASLMANPAEAGELDALSKEYFAAAEVLKVYAHGRDNAVKPEDVVVEARKLGQRRQAFINIRDLDGGYIDMDVTFYPEIDNASPSHQTVQRFLEFVNKDQLRPAAANDPS